MGELSLQDNTGASKCSEVIRFVNGLCVDDCSVWSESHVCHI